MGQSMSQPQRKSASSLLQRAKKTVNQQPSIPKIQQRSILINATRAKIEEQLSRIKAAQQWYRQQERRNVNNIKRSVQTLKQTKNTNRKTKYQEMIQEYDPSPLLTELERLLQENARNRRVVSQLRKNIARTQSQVLAGKRKAARKIAFLSGTNAINAATLST
jgi:Zn-dependent metalloprotease